MTYKIAVKEELERIIEIEANCKEEALNKVEKAYSNEEIVLDESDFKGVEIKEYCDEIEMKKDKKSLKER